MKYYEGRNEPQQYGEVYICNHILYDVCTLFRDGARGLAIVQKRYNPALKVIRYTSIDPCLANDIYQNPNFKEYFDEHAGTAVNGVYPTVEVRKVMWALKMRPIKPEPWERGF